MNSSTFPLTRAPAWTFKAPATPAAYQVIDSNGGVHRASSYEYNVAKALESYGVDFIFQVEYWGGRSFLGGVVLDFLVFTKPQSTPVFVQGDYWHSGERNQLDLLQAAMIGAIPNTKEAVMLWGQDTATYEDARRSVRLKVL